MLRRRAALPAGNRVVLACGNALVATTKGVGPRSAPSGLGCVPPLTSENTSSRGPWGPAEACPEVGGVQAACIGAGQSPVQRGRVPLYSLSSSE